MLYSNNSKQQTRETKMNKSKIKATLNVKCFIVPNKPINYGGKTGNYIVGSDNGNWYCMKCFADLGNKCFHYGIDPMKLDVTVNTQWIQVWFYDDEHDNLTDHGSKMLSDLKLPTRMPEYLPEEFMKGVKEGDTKTVYIKYNKFGESFEDEKVIELNIKFVQGGSRYSRFGTIDEILKSFGI